MNEESKAIKEVAKTTGKSIDAAREAGSFIARFVSGPLEQGVGIFEDKLQYMRWERQVRLMNRADEFLKNSGLAEPSKNVPLMLAIPLFQEASLEENDEMQDRWAMLLVNAANADFGSDIHRSYIDILKQITPLEAKILDAIYSLPFELTQQGGVIISNLPGFAQVAEKQEHGQSAPPSNEVMLALGNLRRLGCLGQSFTWSGSENFNTVRPTVLGRSFVNACRFNTEPD